MSMGKEHSLRVVPMLRQSVSEQCEGGVAGGDQIILTGEHYALRPEVVTENAAPLRSGAATR